MDGLMTDRAFGRIVRIQILFKADDAGPALKEERALRSREIFVVIQRILIPARSKYRPLLAFVLPLMTILSPTL